MNTAKKTHEPKPNVIEPVQFPGEDVTDFDNLDNVADDYDADLPTDEDFASDDYLMPEYLLNDQEGEQ